MPAMFGKEAKKKELIANLGTLFEQLQREYNISAGDFPRVERMQEILQHHDFTKFHPMKPKLIEQVSAADDVVVTKCTHVLLPWLLEDEFSSYL